MILPVIRERIASYQGLGIHEMDTRASLINPILNALGWRVGDPRAGAPRISLSPL